MEVSADKFFWRQEEWRFVSQEQSNFSIAFTVWNFNLYIGDEFGVNTASTGIIKGNGGKYEIYGI